MDYFTVEITTVSGVTTQAIFKRDSINAALSAFHYYFASCMANENCEEAMCMIVDRHGNVSKREHWIAPTADE